MGTLSDELRDGLEELVKLEPTDITYKGSDFRGLASYPDHSQDLLDATYQPQTSLEVRITAKELGAVRPAQREIFRIAGEDYTIMEITPMPVGDPVMFRYRLQKSHA